MTPSRTVRWPAVLYVGFGAACVALACGVRAAGHPVSWLLLVVPGALLAVAVVHAFVAVASRRTGVDASRTRSLAGVFGVAPRPLLAVSGFVFVTGWLVGAFAMASLDGQAADDGPPSCPYYLSDHGARTCVTSGEYVWARAVEQALVCAALGAFLAGCGALTAGGTEPAQERDHRVRITGRV